MPWKTGSGIRAQDADETEGGELWLTQFHGGADGVQ